MISGLPSQPGPSPRCETCGLVTAKLGKLPRIGLRPLVFVYKCEPCNQIISIEPEPRAKLAPPSLR